MAKLTWSNAQITRLVKAAKAEKAECLTLVKDEGIYLMVFGETPAQNTVEYAKGYDPRKADVWEKSAAAVGGDDFGEYLDITAFTSLLEQNAMEVFINVTPTHLKVGGYVL